MELKTDGKACTIHKATMLFLIALVRAVHHRCPA